MSYDYLASPYSHPDPRVRELRYQLVLEHTANLLRAGTHVFSPIVHCHELARLHNLPKDASFWKAYNEAMLRRAGRLRILRLPGWEQSRGIRYERGMALEFGISKIIVDEPGGLNVTKLRKLAKSLS